MIIGTLELLRFNFQAERADAEISQQYATEFA